MPDRKTSFVLDVISLIKSKHAVLNKRSSSQKPKSVTFKEEEEADEFRSKFSAKDKHGQGGKVDMFATMDPKKGIFNKNDLIT